jgi:putative ABC transport system permease protein
MSWLDDIFTTRPFGNKARNAQLSEEIREHLEERIDELVADGMTRADASAQARREFGNVALVEHDSREVWQWPRLERLAADVRYAVRVLAKTPGFTAIVILTLALGIGANTAIFSVVNGVLLRSLPFPQPKQLVDIASKSTMFDFTNLGLSIPDIKDIADPKNGATAFTAIAPYQYSSKEITDSGKPQKIESADVSKEWFDVLALPPLLGRTFTTDDVAPGNHTAVLSYQLWRERFAGDPDVIGKSITLDGQPHTIIGVMPERVAEAYPTFALWTPLHPSKDDTEKRSNHMYSVIARLKPGVTLAQAQSQLDALSTRFATAYPTDDKGWSVHAQSLAENLLGDARTPLLVLFCAAGFVLLIGCANVSNLFLSRGWARRREFAIRSAIGATRGALLRQLFIESLLVSLAGGACAFLIAVWTTSALRKALPPDIPRLDSVAIDGRAALFAVGASLAAAILAGLAPALLSSRQNMTTAIKESGTGGGSTSGAGHNVLRRLLVVAEVALAVMLLIGATLAVRNFSNLLHADVGFRPDHIVTMRLDFPDYRFTDPERSATFSRQVLEQTRSIEGVEAATVGLMFPLGDMISETAFATEESAKDPSAAHQSTKFNSVAPGYFGALGIPLLSGRDFNDGDVKGAPRAFIVNEAFARKVFGTPNAVGKRFATPSDSGEMKFTEIVGVVGNERDARADKTLPEPEIYSPLFQYGSVPGIYLAARTVGDPHALVPVMEDRIWAIDKSQPISEVKTATEMLEEKHAAPRSQSILLGIFAGLGFVLALVGVYGVMSYLVSQQSREIAIRIALGAEASTIFKWVVGHGLKLALVGVAVGIAAALALTRFMHALLYGISATDPTTFVAVALTLTAVAVAACLVPARRAMRVDPMTALRCE